MRKNLLIILAVVFTVSFADAQRVLIDFEVESPTFGECFGNGSTQGNGCFGVISNPDQSGINMSDSVGQFIEPAEGETWMGMFFDLTNLDSPVDLTTAGGNTQLCMDVWTATSVPFTFKVENFDGSSAINAYEGGRITPTNTSQSLLKNKKV